MRNYFVELLNTDQKEQFEKYYDLLIQWNANINLTAVTERDEVWLKHFFDSLSISDHLDMNEINSVIDVGTGAGFPGIPLKIAFPHIHLTLLDSLNKRVGFLQEVVDFLNLSDVRCIHGRAEELGHDPDYREKYDLCVSRAVANLSSLSEFCIPFVRPGGLFVPYKSEKAEEEILQAGFAIDTLGGRIENVKEFILGDQYSRCLIMIRKISDTDHKYPRRPGVPIKKPLVG